MKKSFNPEDCIAALNNLKKGYKMRNLPFSGKQLRSGLHNCGLPSSNTFFKAFKDSGIIQEVSRGKYMFSDDKPIHVSRLSTIQRKYLELGRQYSKRFQQKSKIKPNTELTEVLTCPIEEDPKALIQFAIDLLKDQGYQILAPVGIIYKSL